MASHPKQDPPTPLMCACTCAGSWLHACSTAVWRSSSFPEASAVLWSTSPRSSGSPCITSMPTDSNSTSTVSDNPPGLPASLPDRSRSDEVGLCRRVRGLRRDSAHGGVWRQRQSGQHVEGEVRLPEGGDDRGWSHGHGGLPPRCKYTVRGVVLC